MSTTRLGYLLSILGIVFGVLYLAAVLATMTIGGGFPVKEPYLTIVSAVTYLSVPGIVLLWVAIYQSTPTTQKVFSLGSLALIIIFATLTSINRYNALTVVHQATAQGITNGLDWFQPYGWPSIMAAMEVQAWGVYLGLAFLILAPVFQTGKLEKTIFWVLVITGIICLISALGQVIEINLLTTLGIAAWGPGFIILLALLAAWFKHPQAEVSLSS